MRLLRVAPFFNFPTFTCTLPLNFSFFEIRMTMIHITAIKRHFSENLFA